MADKMELFQVAACGHNGTIKKNRRGHNGTSDKMERSSRSKVSGYGTMDTTHRHTHGHRTLHESSVAVCTTDTTGRNRCLAIIQAKNDIDLRIYHKY